jgi:hypothetical protein
MSRFSIAALLVLALAMAAPAQDTHCDEPGTHALFTRSSFAHGYRHGYEAGYHEGNMDINMARQARTRFKQFKGLPLGYEHSFGSKKSFELGFALGLEAGYGDGYAGRAFRAVASLRTIGESLKPAADASDPSDTFFDRGMTLGYQDGFASSRSGGSQHQGILPIDMESVKCAFRAGKKAEAAAESSYCDGYRRGFVLGQSDKLDLSPEQVLLEASK